jgi:hypothetical protein
MVPEPDLGLFIGMRGRHLAKLFVDKLIGNPVPAYFDRLNMKGDELLERAFK